MAEEKRPDETRRNIGLIFVIIIGLIIGIFIKRVQIGLIIGIVIGLLATSLRKR